MEMGRGETKEKVMIFKERKYQSNNKYKKVRYCDDKYLDSYHIAVERVHCDKCQIKILSILFHTCLFPSRKFLMSSVNKNLTFDFRQFCCKKVATEKHGKTVRRT